MTLLSESELRQVAEAIQAQLADVGISHSDRSAELDKPFWR